MFFGCGAEQTPRALYPFQETLRSGQRNRTSRDHEDYSSSHMKLEYADRIGMFLKGGQNNIIEIPFLHTPASLVAETIINITPVFLLGEIKHDASRVSRATLKGSGTSITWYLEGILKISNHDTLLLRINYHFAQIGRPGIPTLIVKNNEHDYFSRSKMLKWGL